MRKNDFIRMGIAFIITSALISFINLASNLEVDNKLDIISPALSITFGVLGFIMIILGMVITKKRNFK